MQSFHLDNEIIRIENLNLKNYNNSYLDLLKELSNSEIDSDINKIKYHIKNLNSNHSIKILINASDVIIGSITILKEKKIIHNFGTVAHLEDVVVIKKYRGKKLGNKLINIAKNECEDCYKIILNCSEDKVKFYEKNGFYKKNVQMAIYKN